MSTSILAIGTTAADSASVSVTAGAPATIGLFVTGGGTIPYSNNPVLCLIEDPNLALIETSIQLDSLNPVTLLIAPGTYTFRRPAGFNVGIFSEV